MPVVLESTSAFLIKEQLRNSPIPLPGIPRSPIPGTAPGLLKLQRLVFQVREEADVLFKGRVLDHHVGLYEWFIEQITPGQQITTMRTGQKRLVIMYYGIKNIVTAPYQISSRRADLGWIDYLGDDPIPQAVLYGNPRISFVSGGGLEHQTAMAFFDASSDTLEEIPIANRTEIIRSFQDSLAH